MKIVITGGTGYVGSQLTDYLVANEHDVYILTRSPEKYTDSDQVKHIGWLKEEFSPSEHLHAIDAFVNLAGDGLNDGRWTDEKKRSILNSRVEATEGVLDIIDQLEQKPKVLVNASAVGFYGQSKTKTFTEETTESGKDFLANVVAEWEERASKAQLRGVRTVCIRFGVILGEKGALQKMVLPYKMMIGGNLGSGEQWMSWVHIEDVLGLIDFAIHEEKITGPLNGTAPNPKRNKDFGKTLGTVLNRPHWITAPSLAIRAVFGEMSSLVLTGQSVIPKLATEKGYTFHYPELQPALESILHQ